MPESLLFSFVLNIEVGQCTVSTRRHKNLVQMPNFTFSIAPLARRSRCLVTEAASSSTASSPPPPSDPKIGRIVDDISGLTLLQAADLVTLLKVCSLLTSFYLTPNVGIDPKSHG
jgi:hypothetical protein